MTSIWRNAARYSDLITACIAMVAISTYDSMRTGYSGVEFVLLFPLALIVLLAAWIVRGVMLAIETRWLSAARQLAKIITLCALFIPSIYAGDYIHLIVMYPRYLHTIAAARQTDKPLRFEWGDKALWATDGLQFDTLVYDPSDELSAAIGKDRGGGGTGLATRHLLGHFYVEREFSE